MKVLLTGANGFVGSRILDLIVHRNISTVILLRKSSSQRLINHHLARVEVRRGSIIEPDTLPSALENVTHVIHCAGCTKAIRESQYMEVNQIGVRNLVGAVNDHANTIQQFIHISSLAASHAAGSEDPAREDDASAPISPYGRSKLAGEEELRRHCRAPWVILRPAAVYGPGDTDFLKLFKAVRSRFLPEFAGGRQELSLVHVDDLAEAVLRCLNAEPGRVTGRTFNVAAQEIVTARALSDEISRQMQVRTLRIPLPTFVLWLACAIQGALSRLTGTPSILNLEKFPELRAAGWVCDTRQLAEQTGFTCRTTLREGIALTLAWYREKGWL